MPATLTPAANGAAKLLIQLLPGQQMIQLAQRDFAQIAPGEFLAACPPQFAPKVGIIKWMRATNGTYQPVIQALPTMVHRSEWRANLYGCSWHTVLRLALAGFVNYVRPSWRATAIELDSYFAHLQEVRNDPDWWTPERRAKLEAVKAHTLPLDEEEVEPEAEEATAEEQLGMRL